MESRLDHPLEQALTELQRYPRGPRGSLQNLFRLAFFDAREHSLGKKAEIHGHEAAVDLALRIVRVDDPAFMPRIAA